MRNKPAAQDRRLEREDSTRLSLPNKWGVPVHFCANQDIQLESGGVDDLENLLSVQDTIEEIRRRGRDFFPDGEAPTIREVVLTPDFHKGKGMPVGAVIATTGFVLPQAMGNDVNCGMRLMSTSLTREQLTPCLDALEKSLRYEFFEGGRNLPMTPIQRQALLQEGLPGLLATWTETQDLGLWSNFDPVQEEKNLACIHGQGGYPVKGIFALKDYADSSRGLSQDSIIGSLGGGNHFAEIQYVKKIHDGRMAHACGLFEGQVMVMVHTGSLSIGHVTGQFFLDLIKEIYPKGLAHPQNGFFPLPAFGRFRPHFEKFKTSMCNAANFAFGNRLFLSLMMQNALESVLGPCNMNLIYDAPHNLIWEETMEGQPVFIHRKGATPAYGFERMEGSPYAYYGEPVIAPGSMGASSFLMRGVGNKKWACSACHGAGRMMSRGAAMNISDQQLDEFLNCFRVVTPVDFKSQALKQRPDIVSKIRMNLKQEAPFAYKSVTPAIQTLSSADVAHPVVELYPLMTVKG